MGFTAIVAVILVAILVGGIVFMIFGSTDPGEPIAQIVAVGAPLVLLRVTPVPLRRALVRLRHA